VHAHSDATAENGRGSGASRRRGKRIGVSYAFQVPLTSQRSTAMARVVREAKYIKSDVQNNNNKFWYITEYDDSTCVVQFGRVGGEGATKTHGFGNQLAAQYFFDKKCREKEGDRKGYRPLQVLNVTTGAVATAAVAQQQVHKVAAEQIQADCPQTQALV